MSQTDPPEVSEQGEIKVSSLRRDLNLGAIACQTRNLCLDWRCWSRGSKTLGLPELLGSGFDPDHDISGSESQHQMLTSTMSSHISNILKDRSDMSDS